MIERPDGSRRSQFILLGARASRTSFPDGARSLRQIPVMHELVDTLALRTLIERVVRFQNEDFELIYSRLAADSQHDATKREIGKVGAYFSSLNLPEEATIYNRILLSLRKGDAVFTFDWDTFLFDAYADNPDVKAWTYSIL